MSFAVGTLVRARGREWVVLPDTSDECVVLRPLGGTDDEVTGILTSLEDVEAATFDLPDPTRPGDHRSARMLRDALRLGFRSSAGPFRSFGRIAVEPRPYQLVPLLVGLRLDPVRLLIADDVGIGKTIEAALLAKELLERGETTRLAVLCPPHLAEQWQAELKAKFHIEADLVLPSTVRRLERGLRVGQSLFERFPFVVVSTDFIKSDRYRGDFLRTCPELVIVDEAHTCAIDAGPGGRGRQMRHELVSGLAADPERHLVLVTATPHSGKEGAFRSLLTLLDPDLGALPDDLSGDDNRHHREHLARHLVQRRRPDIRSYLDADTPFPARMELEVTYTLSADYRRLFDRVLAYARETVRDPSGGQHRQRVRWWSALALLRSLASSPAAAAATLRTRAAAADTATTDEADAVGRRTVLDIGEDDEAEAVDMVPGSDDEAEDGDAARTRRRLRDLAREAEALMDGRDAKLQEATKRIAALVKDGFRPIVFCRFIPTAEYVAEHLRTALPKGVEVAAVTGTLPPAERELRVQELAEADRRVLVATDCLSEGINLQDHFDAVFHYDLSWNPTRHEQREGRVDRFGQARPEVRVITYYGTDNQIDGLVLDVLLRKHRQIRSALGVSVPVPADSNAVVEAILEGLLLRQDRGGVAERLPGMEEFLRPRTQALEEEWQNAAEREKRSRTLFAQHTITVDEVSKELQAAQQAVGSATDVAHFTRTAVEAHRGLVTDERNDAVRIDLGDTPRALRDALGRPDPFLARFSLPVPDGHVHLGRTSPFVTGLASYVLDTALDPALDAVAARCSAVRTDAVTTLTTLLLARFRFHVRTSTRGDERQQLAEEAALLAFTGSASAPTWLADEEIESLLAARPRASVPPAQATDFLTDVLAARDSWLPTVNQRAEERAAALEAAHTRVRRQARQRGVRHRVEPQLPADVLGVYVFLPAPGKP